MALNDVSLEFADNMTTVLIGPSGCGKSTVLRLVMGLLRPDQGRIDATLSGTPFDLGAPDLREFQRRVGYVVQEGGLFPHLSNRDNLTIVARQLGWSKERIKKRVSELCQLTSLPEQLLSRFPSEVSGGQRQRVSLMRALLLDPDLLLLDEPLGALDPMVRYDLQRELRQVFSRLKRTVILVTHDLSEAAFLGDEIVLMREGRVVQKGALRSLVERPAEPFVRAFITAQRKWGENESKIIARPA